jgi:uncharacterized membrane protein YgcG
MRYWRRCALAFSILLSLAYAFADERILNYQSEIQIQPDASLQVHETIKVRSEGRSIRHGIYRDFPTKYRGRMGENYVVGFDVIDVRRDGDTESYTQEAINNGVRVKIGSASTLLPRGEHVFDLTYRVTREIGFFPTHDELYWNVTGNFWNFPIDHASAIVTLPQPVSADKLLLSGYTGPQGSKAQNLIMSRINDTQVEFAITQPLGSYEGMTIVVEFPKGIVAEPTTAQKTQFFFLENATVTVAFAGLVIVLVYYFFAWMRVGRDPRRGTVVVQYEPPPNMSPAAISFLRHMGYDDRVLVSAVVNLAVKQYLSIQQEASVYRLQKLKSEDSHLAPEEINLMRNLFRTSDAIDVTQGEHLTFQLAKATLTADLNRGENQKLFQKHRKAIWPGILLSLATLAGIVLTMHAQYVFIAGFLSFWLSIWSAATGAAVFATIKSIRSHGRNPVGNVIGAVVLSVIDIVVLGVFANIVGYLPAFALLLLIIANFVFAHLLASFTPEGRKLMDHVEGFELFLTEVDSDRLQRQGAPAKTPALFEKCLPYALALGVEQAWSRQFEGVLAQAAIAGTRSTAYSPAWYSSNDWSGFNANSFASGFGGDFSSAMSSASTPPGSSSGGGGGGSSGGGGGGGGGGGW